MPLFDKNSPINNRARIGWWMFILILGIAAAFIAYSFVGMVVLGVFGYYATRPIYRQLGNTIDSDSIAAGVTAMLVIIPIILLATYAGFQAFQQVQQLLGGATGSMALSGLPPEQRQAFASVIQNPRQLFTNPQQTIQTVLQAGLRAITAISGALVLIGLAGTLSYFLLEREEELSDGLVELVGGRETTAYAYASAVDEDLESVFFGNLLFVLVMSVIAIVTYWGTNLFTPQPLHVPMIFVLGFLTGIASLIPIVVGKIIYVPVVAYLAFQAVGASSNLLVIVGGVLIIYFLVLDILPQTFIQPYITGRQLDMVVMMFAYLLGPILFGWYGFFLLPIIFIVLLEAIRIPLPELIHGETLTPDVSLGESVGTNPEVDTDTPDDAAAENDDTSSTTEQGE